MPKSEALQNHADPGDRQYGECHPGQIGFRLTGCPDDQGSQHDEADGVGDEYLQCRGYRQ